MATYARERDAVHVPPPSTPDERAAAVLQAAEAVHRADALLFTAGAGMGIDSGLPDFRGTTTGLFAGRTEMSYEQMSDDAHFSSDPAFAWGVNFAQLKMYREAEPHAGYSMLKKWAVLFGKPYFVWTSNIDEQFVKAGYPPQRVVTCHGDMHHLQCTDRRCCDEAGEEHAWSAEALPTNVGVDAATMRLQDASVLDAPAFRCPRCGVLARPNVWFCQDRNYRSRADRHEASRAYREWLDALQEGKKRLVVIECGAGLAIPTVRYEGEDAVSGAGPGSCLVRINPTDCRVPAERSVALPFGAADGLAQLDVALRQRLRTRKSPAKPPSKPPAKPTS